LSTATGIYPHISVTRLPYFSRCRWIRDSHTLPVWPRGCWPQELLQLSVQINRLTPIQLSVMSRITTKYIVS